MKNSVIICPELAYRYTVLQASVTNRQGGGVNWAFGPYPGGKWEIGVASFCERIGMLMDKSGPSILNTHPSKAYITLDKQKLVGLSYAATESVDGKKTYLHLFLPPKTNVIELPPPADGRKFTSAKLLSNNHPVKVNQTAKGVTLTVGKSDRWDDVDTIIVLQ
jgi:hypothetical protein